MLHVCARGMPICIDPKMQGAGLHACYIGTAEIGSRVNAWRKARLALAVVQGLAQAQDVLAPDGMTALSLPKLCLLL